MPLARVRELAARARKRGERALLVVEMDGVDGVPVDFRQATGGAPVDRADRLAARLGTENACLVHDTRAGLDPALLGAEAGTVPAGGLLVLLVPPLATRGRAASGVADGHRSRFTERFHRHLLAYLERHPATSARITLSPMARAELHALHLPAGGVPAERAGIIAQDTLLERLATHLDGDGRPLVVVEAPRGHGKSALLGRLAARLERAGRPYRVSAARRAAADVLDRHRRRALAAGAGPGAPGAAPPPAPASRSGPRQESPPLPFVAPDAALAGHGEWLIVDEAASLPLPLLEGLLGRYRRIVLATTTQGHESAGRAFAVRLPAVLERERAGWLRLAPAVPLRWAAGDPLDALIRNALLPRTVLDGAAGDGADPFPADASLPDAHRIDRDALARDERRLDALAALFAATHYQSTPLDLVHLLDAPGLAIWTIERGAALFGAALLAVEPGVERALHAEVLARRRRLPHRLLPQLLAQSADRDDALGADFARVVRIAVHPAARRRGLGSRLVAAMVRDTAGAVEALGASFGETATSCAFWSTNGFTTFHRGFRRNPRSGQRSVAVLRAGSPRTAAVLEVAASIHRDNVGTADATDAERRRHGPASGHAERDRSDAAARRAPTSARDRRLLQRFARGERSLSDSLGALRRLHGIDPSADSGSDGDALSEPLRAAGASDAWSRRRREEALRRLTAERLASGRFSAARRGRARPR